MYSTCLACGSRLPANDVLEHLPVGRRVAFDPERGRLWVVCSRCLRWNLVPFDSRWEALEQCAVALESARLRVSTDEILLARHPSGLDLVRVGAPGPLEMATWRWGDRYSKRRQIRRRWQLAGGAVVAGGVAGAAALGGAATLLIGAGALAYFAPMGALVWYGLPQVRVGKAGEPVHMLTMDQVKNSVLRQHEDEAGWEVEVPPVDHRGEPILFRGDAAELVARRLLAKLNRTGARPKAVESAVARLQSSEAPTAFIRTLASETPRWKGLHNNRRDVNLALEMALYESAERRALEGELAALEAAWRDAEELASISDRLLISDPVAARLSELRTEETNAHAQGQN